MKVLSIEENGIWTFHRDDALNGDWRPAVEMIPSHSENDPCRDIRVATHQLMFEIREIYGCDVCEGVAPLMELIDEV